MKTLINLLLVLATAAFSCTAMADEASVTKLLKEKFPQMPGTPKVRKTPIKGSDVYEVNIGTTIHYTDEKVTFFLVGGSLIDTATMQDLTAGRQNATVKETLAAIPLEKAIKVVYGTGKRKLFVFSDPDCPFCKQFESQLSADLNVTIYTFLYPLTSLRGHENAKDKSIAIWCSKDKGKAWTEWMAGRAQVPVTNPCKHPVDETMAIGQSLQVAGTPTMFFENGRKVPGAIPKDQLKQMLDLVEQEQSGKK